MAAAAILDNFEWPYLRNDSYVLILCYVCYRKDDRASRGHLCDSTVFLLMVSLPVSRDGVIRQKCKKAVAKMKLTYYTAVWSMKDNF